MNYETFFKALTEIVSGACAYQSDLRIFQEQDARGAMVLTAMPHSADYAKLNGRHGTTVNAMRLLTQIAAQRCNARIAYALADSFVGMKDDRMPFAFNPDFDRKKFETLLDCMIQTLFLPVPPMTIEYPGQGIMVTVDLPREGDNETLINALWAVFTPYCYAQGRAVRIRLGSNGTKYERKQPYGDATTA